MKVNREIRAPKIRLIGKDGSQVGIVTSSEGLAMAQQDGLDLVEISPNAEPPVCKIIDYGKYQYQLSKKERESEKGQQQGKLKEIKVRPNIGDHDLLIKVKRGHGFVEKGNKLRVSCMFRGREMAHPERGRVLLDRIVEELEDVAQIESPPKMMGRNMSMVLAPSSKKK